MQNMNRAGLVPAPVSSSTLAVPQKFAIGKFKWAASDVWILPGKHLHPTVQTQNTQLLIKNIHFT
jgi:hypothetical protein